jgi:hypothetical protein
MSQTNVATSNSTAQTNATIYFIPDADVDYAISGFYGLFAGGAPIVSLRLAIRDDVAGPFVYEGVHSSRQIPGESFTLGGSGGNIFDIEEGGLNGTLLAGHQYILTLQTRLFANDTPPSGASASGFVNIAFVPEPSSAVLVGAGLAWLARRRRARPRPLR